MWASVQTVRGCPKHCSFCSVWKTDGQRPRQRGASDVIEEIVELRRKGFRFIALADDNFYPVTLEDLRQASRRADKARLEQLTALRHERFELMERLAELPKDMVFFTQITMEASEDPEFLDAMNRAHIKGALVGIESVTADGLKDIYKGFNATGDELVARLRAFRTHGVHVLGSFIFGLPSDNPTTFDATAALAEKADLTFAQFVMLTPFPGTVDFAAWEKTIDPANQIAGVPITRHWLIPQESRPKVYTAHPVMAADEIRERTQAVWDRFYSLQQIWKRSRCVTSLKARLAFVLISKLYRQMYANTGIATDSARVNRSARWARMIAKPCRRLFSAQPMPNLQVPRRPAAWRCPQRLITRTHSGARRSGELSPDRPPDASARLLDLGLQLDLQRAAQRVRDRALALRFARHLVELLLLDALQALGHDLQLRGRQLDAGVTLVGDDRRGDQRVRDRAALASDGGVERHRVTGRVRGRHQLFGTGVAGRLADPRRERHGQRKRAGAGLRGALAFHDRSGPVHFYGSRKRRHQQTPIGKMPPADRAISCPSP